MQATQEQRVQFSVSVSMKKTGVPGSEGARLEMEDISSGFQPNLPPQKCRLASGLTLP